MDYFRLSINKPKNHRQHNLDCLNRKVNIIRLHFNTYVSGIKRWISVLEKTKQVSKINATD